MVQFRLLILALALCCFLGCGNNEVDLIIEAENTEFDSDTDTSTDTDVDTLTDDTEDEVVANLKVPFDFDSVPLKIKMEFVTYSDSEGIVAADGDEYADPNISPDDDYLYESGQAGLEGYYVLVFVLFVEGGGIDSGIPESDVDYVGSSTPVYLAPGTGGVWAGTVQLQTMDWP